jgi:hypothetical protein
MGRSRKPIGRLPRISNEARYGERKAMVEAGDWEGPKYQTCREAAMVCRKFETSRRREDLTFKHHREVAALPPDEADALLDWCAETPKPRSTRELRSEVHRRRRVKSGERPPNDFCKIEDLFGSYLMPIN